MHFVTNELDRFDRQEIHFFKVRNQIGEFVQKSFSLPFSPQMGFQSETKSQ